jgi:hypothetical protein
MLLMRMGGRVNKTVSWLLARFLRLKVLKTKVRKAEKQIAKQKRTTERKEENPSLVCLWRLALCALVALVVCLAFSCLSFRLALLLCISWPPRRCERTAAGLAEKEGDGEQSREGEKGRKRKQARERKGKGKKSLP